MKSKLSVEKKMWNPTLLSSGSGIVCSWINFRSGRHSGSPGCHCVNGIHRLIPRHPWTLRSAWFWGTSVTRHSRSGSALPIQRHVWLWHSNRWLFVCQSRRSWSWWSGRSWTCWSWRSRSRRSWWSWSSNSKSSSCRGPKVSSFFYCFATR